MPVLHHLPTVDLNPNLLTVSVLFLKKVNSIMASYQFINPLFKSITYHILSLPLAMRLKDERRNAACLFLLMMLSVT